LNDYLFQGFILLILDTTNKVFDRIKGVKNGLQPLVSVIVPTCRHPEILKKAVKSILMQTYHNFEIIVVNDGSYDIYLTIESFGDNRIRLLQHKTQKGPGAARDLKNLAFCCIAKYERSKSNRNS